MEPTTPRAGPVKHINLSVTCRWLGFSWLRSLRWHGFFLCVRRPVQGLAIARLVIVAGPWGSSSDTTFCWAPLQPRRHNPTPRSWFLLVIFQARQKTNSIPKQTRCDHEHTQFLQPTCCAAYRPLILAFESASLAPHKTPVKDRSEKKLTEQNRSASMRQEAPSHQTRKCSDTF